MKKINYILLITAFLFSIYPIYKVVCAKNVGRPDVAIYGPVLMADGIGRQTVELALAFRRKFSVQIKADCVDNTDVPTRVKRIMQKKYKEPAQVVIVENSLWAPGDQLDRFFSKVDGKEQIRYAYSMLESTRIIPEWVMMVNLYFDAVIVPDPFLVDAYQKSGVAVPVFYIPLGIDIDDLLKAPLKEPKTKGPLVFAALGSGIKRKNHKTIIQAFAKALGNNENAWLYINCRMADPEVRDEIIAEIIKQKCTNIKYTELCLRKDAYVKFLSSVDCLLSCSTGEGFSIQPREAMALGVPVIVTDNTAQSTICRTGLAKIVPSPIAEPCHYYGRPLPDGEQFNCSPDELAAAIRDVYLNYSQYASKGPQMRRWAASYNYKNLVPLYETLVAPKKIVLGDVNEVTAESLVTTSRELYDKYMKIAKIK